MGGSGGLITMSLAGDKSAPERGVCPGCGKKMQDTGIFKACCNCRGSILTAYEMCEDCGRIALSGSFQERSELLERCEAWAFLFYWEPEPETSLAQ